MFIKFDQLIISVEHVASVKRITEDDYIVRMSSGGDSHHITKRQYDSLVYLLSSMRSTRAFCDIEDPAVQRYVTRDEQPTEPAA